MPPPCVLEGVGLMWTWMQVMGGLQKAEKRNWFVVCCERTQIWYCKEWLYHGLMYDSMLHLVKLY